MSATFFQQRPQLARKLHEVYEQERMQLEQLMASIVNWAKELGQ